MTLLAIQDSEMIDRVAVALEIAWSDANNVGCPVSTIVLARAAITAMREPTEKMIKAGENADPDKAELWDDDWRIPHKDDPDYEPQWWHCEIRQAMIDAALNEKPNQV